MAEFRVLLDGGAILVVSLSVEEPEEQSLPEPEQIGRSLLAALGLSRPAVAQPARPAKPARRKPADPMDTDNADTWLRRTSEKSLGQKFPRKVRADGDTED